MRLLSIALFMTSFSALAACPDLSGTYPVCKSVDGVLDDESGMVISQRIENNVTIYSSVSMAGVPSDDMIMDGSERTIHTSQDDGSHGIEVTSSKCEGNAVVSKSVMTTGNDVVTTVGTISKEGNGLRIDIASSSASGKVENNFNVSVICQ